MHALGAKVLFRGGSFVAVDKPGGWLSVPSRFGARDPRPCVGTELQVRLGIRLWPVHRLDEEATGLLLFATTAEAHREASRWFEERQVVKTYEAWTEQAGEAPPAGEQAWESRLLRGKKRAYASPHGKWASTRARCSGATPWAGGEAHAWIVRPHTGRPHQIRFELALHGFPVIGDVLYGAHSTFAAGEIALRCTRLDFVNREAASGLGLPERLEAPGLAEHAAQLPTA